MSTNTLGDMSLFAFWGKFPNCILGKIPQLHLGENSPIAFWGKFPNCILGKCPQKRLLSTPVEGLLFTQGGNSKVEKLKIKPCSPFSFPSVDSISIILQIYLPFFIFKPGKVGFYFGGRYLTILPVTFL